jgi:hypothetical protein
MSRKREGKERGRDDVAEEDSGIPNGPWDLRLSGKSYVEQVAELDLRPVAEKKEFSDDKEWEVDKDLINKSYSSSDGKLVTTFVNQIGGQALPRSSSYLDAARRGSHAAQRRHGGGSAQTGAAAATPLPIGTPGGRWFASIFNGGSNPMYGVYKDRMRAQDIASVEALVEVSELILLRVFF